MTTNQQQLARNLRHEMTLLRRNRFQSQDTLAEIACARLGIRPDYGDRLLIDAGKKADTGRKRPHSVEARANISVGIQRSLRRRRAA